MSESPSNTLKSLEQTLEASRQWLMQVALGGASDSSGLEQQRVHLEEQFLTQARQLAGLVGQLAPDEQQRLRALRGSFTRLELLVRRAGHDLSSGLSVFLPTSPTGSYSSRPGRTASAGAWMNVRSTP